jgi:hypothetical protein
MIASGCLLIPQSDGARRQNLRYGSRTFEVAAAGIAQSCLARLPAHRPQFDRRNLLGGLVILSIDGHRVSKTVISF